MNEQLELKAEVSIDDAGTITGMAWPFGAPDSVGDIISKGAFSFPATLPIVMEHDQAKVVGVWDGFTETDAGLEVKGRLFIEGIEPARAARQLVRKGQVKGLSISFQHTGFTALANGGREFDAVTVTEISLCRRPVHPGAVITTVKSIQGNPMDPETIAENAALELKAANDNVAKLTARLDKLEAKGNRPVAANDNDGPSDERKAFTSYLRLGTNATEIKALSVSSDPQGGFFAPAEVSSEFIRDLVEVSPMRTVATVRTTGAPSVILPKRTGITNAKWRGELQANSGSEPAFGQTEVFVKEVATYIDISLQLLEDGPSAEAEVRLALADDFGQKEGLAFVKGDGVLQPRGFLTVDEVAESLNGHATILSADALIAFMYSLPVAYRSRGSWVLNGGSLATIRKLKDGQGNYLWQPSYQLGQPETILGRPVVEMVDMPDIAAGAYPIAFGDFATGYRIYDRLEMSVLSDPYTQQVNGLARIHARRRTGGDVVQPKALRKLKMA